MALRIKEIAKSKGISMTDIADRLGINPITLSKSLNGNPTLSRLTEVAGILGVDVAELFEYQKKGEDIHGCIFVEGKPVIINNKDELFELVRSINSKGKDS